LALLGVVVQLILFSFRVLDDLVGLKVAFRNPEQSRDF
jgi:hypothetical protein